jgi:hypothetical protein
MMSPTLKAQRVAGVSLTGSSAIMDTPSANMENPSATIEFTRRFIICCEGLTATMVADKSCGVLLGFFEHLLIARHETARASIFQEGWRFAIEQAQGHC